MDVVETLNMFVVKASKVLRIIWKLLADSAFVAYFAPLVKTYVTFHTTKYVFFELCK